MIRDDQIDAQLARAAGRVGAANPAIHRDDERDAVGVETIDRSRLKVGDDKAQAFFGKKNEPGPVLTVEEKGDSGLSHFANFIDCVRTRKAENLKAPIEEGHYSTALCHLGNISYRLRRSLKFDGANERFAGDDEANGLLSRTYRTPYSRPAGS